MNTEDIKKEITVISGNLTGRKITINLIGILIIGLLIGMAFWGYSSYKAALAKAEQMEADVKKVQQKLEETEKQRIEDTKNTLKSIEDNKKSIKDVSIKQASIDKTIKERDTKTNKDIDTVTEYDRPVAKVAEDIKNFLYIEPKVVPEGFVFSTQQAAGMVALKIDRDRLENNLADKEHELMLEKQKVELLNQSIERATKALEDSNKALDNYKELVKQKDEVIEAYKKAAKKSKWAIARDIGIQVAITAAVTAAVAR